MSNGYFISKTRLLLSRKTTFLKLVHKRFLGNCLKGCQFNYQEFGEPLEVLEKCSFPVRKPECDEVVLRVLAAPVNPVDINTIQGKYPYKPECFPAIPGNEGVAEILELGDEVDCFEEGDYVIPLSDNLGWWSSYMTVKANDVYSISKEIDIADAASISINGCTAYRMLKDFTCLEDGDVVVQNGANSAVGQMIIQLCKHWGYKTLNIMRDRDNFEEVCEYLKGLGADHVIREEEARAKNLLKCLHLQKPKLGLNCIGGNSATYVMKLLDKKSYFVTYGGMSRKPVQASVGDLVFKNIKAVGFWMTQWRRENLKSQKQLEMLDELLDLCENKQLKAAAHRMIKIEEINEALEVTLSKEGKSGCKYILNFDECETLT